MDIDVWTLVFFWLVGSISMSINGFAALYNERGDALPLAWLKATGVQLVLAGLAVVLTVGWRLF